MDYQALAALLFPNVTDTPEMLEEKYPARNLPECAVVTRMAPSPTGFVHLGNLLQGMIAERMAHQSGGVPYFEKIHLFFIGLSCCQKHPQISPFLV